ncbi:sensor histidine kinase [Halostella litorea]|uniref:sensor histidine kinase n=1 Tax=Halostella litorea TaxID=2528831 RepID=UPI001092C696|nr:HAMP domain-containing sensor histidine kinase [Halostella litorea]
MDTRRLTAAVVLSATGVGLGAIAARQLLQGVSGLPGIVVTGATLLLGVAFTVAGPAAYRTGVSSRHLLRIAGWNTLGVVVTTAVLLLVYLFQVATGATPSAPLLSGALIVGVSAFAHVLIGFNDVRRIRARTVARQRKKAGVIHRFVRHNLKHVAQMLLGYGEQLTATDGGGANHTIGEQLLDIGTDLGETQEQIQLFEEMIGTDGDRTAVELTEVIDKHRAALEEQYPEASVETALPESLPALAGERIDPAFGELLENAFEHGGDPPTVRITGERDGDRIDVEILDAGDGFPDHELALINGDKSETQLRHSSGLGLWLATWITETYGGSLRLANRENGGGRVSIQLPAAP